MTYVPTQPTRWLSGGCMGTWYHWTLCRMRTFPFPQSVGAFLGAIPVALQGYVIVATDYAGLDVELDISPVTDILGHLDPIATIPSAAMGPGTAAAFPEFKVVDIFTTDELQTMQTLLHIEECSAVSSITEVNDAYFSSYNILTEIIQIFLIRVGI
ncbi:hypothetical protein SS1G_01808 [Sclerotinia sclerotiorum 1980 UF-70]|uniref:Uncharacterized protein n=1 Tax=Sclerotinia sclerotiorum (strain ATCC 18683 / 1980 / Ss-1) TaxID=665079 RepID=A7E928_SCLS1|nr:hypothetical protein SS1G_01808 [Sclerotinia sclerotiorum 1980 UF-70]EDN96880.1 hypothetical protein SS1G_01808 [Sclerotinia sclerotiorum 1980 UF-70]